MRNLSLDDQTSFFSFFSLVSAYCCCCCCCWHLDSREEDEKRKEKGKKKNAETDLLHLALREPSLMCTALVLPCCALFVQPSELISPLNDLTYSIQCPSHLFFIPFFKKKKRKRNSKGKTIFVNKKIRKEKEKLLMSASTESGLHHLTRAFDVESDDGWFSSFFLIFIRWIGMLD